MIKDVKVKKLALHSDERGKLMELIRFDDTIFEKFGQVYMTTCRPGFVKAWHMHKVQSDNMACIRGKVRVGLFDGRESSPTVGKVQEFIISIENPLLVQIPAGVYHGFECLTDEEAIVINIPSECYNPETPDEFRRPFDDFGIPLKWNSKKGG